jgi:magnesium and cobalt exporter, CNNM family
MELRWALSAVPVLIALNAFFVAAEYALVAIRGPQIEALRRRGRARAAAAMARLKADPASAIGAIQVCITMTNLLLGWVGEPAMTEVLGMLFAPLADLVPPALFRGVSLGLSFVVVTLATVVFSELLPKALTLRYVPRVAVFTAVPVLFVLRAVRPLVWLMNTMADLVTRPLGLGSVTDMEKEWHTAEEIRQIASQAAEHGALTLQERALVLNSLALGRRRARQIMVPRTRVVYLDLRRPMEENRRVINDYLHTRFPLCDGGLDRVAGWVPTKEFLAAYHAAGDVQVLLLLARKPVFQPENITLDRLLTTFHRDRTGMVFLVDEYGGVEGIVTLQDVVDELLAGLARPDDRATKGALATPSATAEGPAEAPAPPAPLEVAGDTPVHELAARLGRPEWAADDGAVTVGGVVVSRLGRVPAAGEEVTVDGVRLRVLDSDGKVVRRLAVEPLSMPADAEAPVDMS